jgi:hypothetical protein
MRIASSWRLWSLWISASSKVDAPSRTVLRRWSVIIFN